MRWKHVFLSLCVASGFSGAALAQGTRPSGVAPPQSLIDIPLQPAELSGLVPPMNYRGKAGNAIHVMPTRTIWAERVKHGIGPKLSGSGSNLMYHCLVSSKRTCVTGAPVITNATIHAIYWTPSDTSSVESIGGSSSYQKVVNASLGAMPESIEYVASYDAGWAGGDPSHPRSLYNIATQYFQIVNSTNQFIQDHTGEVPNAAIPGSTTVTDAYPQPGCTDSAAPTPSNCVFDSQIQQMLKNQVLDRYTVNLSTDVFLVYLQPGEGNCIDGTTACAYTNYCGYHSEIKDSNNNPLLYYAVIPYAPYWNQSICQGSQNLVNSTSSKGADIAVNLSSHELIEMVTDPGGNAWFDSRGYEIADKCAWNFGPSVNADGWNQEMLDKLVTGQIWYFDLQQEWSNANSACQQLM